MGSKPPSGRPPNRGSGSSEGFGRGRGYKSHGRGSYTEQRLGTGAPPSKTRPKGGGAGKPPAKGGSCCPMVAAVGALTRGRYRLARRYAAMSVRLIAARVIAW